MGDFHIKYLTLTAWNRFIPSFPSEPWNFLFYLKSNKSNFEIWFWRRCMPSSIFATHKRNKNNKLNYFCFQDWGIWYFTCLCHLTIAETLRLNLNVILSVYFINITVMLKIERFVILTVFSFTYYGIKILLRDFAYISIN